ncbi:PhnD/SsuA/transferrin family substrate-binding protein [Sediminicoccus sp. KRV36]|uniref:phosphate/phosphite/phosphonate ABC transporter substrate-binding protein n=1 Tax=Sediminicoccus sp. KRV36 TaxID=3133721 RepID=UPI00200C84BB|nr:PhnD/SsuA/transferrin family substrate-binding protein [Sediminicoccus rosea]UPY39067.1 phosphate/phosphite/phosphonate ABC transporter substrate-binding protein [Sediminicoccus rosea]
MAVMLAPTRRSLLRHALPGGALLVGLPPASAQPAPLQFGVMPNVSTRILLGQYQPFRGFLEQELGRAVEVVTAPGLQAFHERSVAGAYGLVVTAANLGRVAQLDAGLRPIAIYEPRIPGLIVTLRSRPLASAAELRGLTVAMTNPQSLVALKFIHWLRAQGMEIGRDASATHARNEDSLAQLLNTPETRAAVMSRGEFNAIRADIRENLVIWQEFTRVPGFLVLLGPRLDQAESARVTAAIGRLPESEAGRAFFAATGFNAIRPVTPADLAELDDVVDETRAFLRAP